MPRPFKTSLDDETKHAIEQYDLFRSISRLGVAVSGGADSLALLDTLERLRSEQRIDVQIIPIHIDQYRRHDDVARLRQFVSKRYGSVLHVATVDTRAVAQKLLDRGKAPCRGCAPLRAEALATAAKELNLDAVALGHHLNDAVATLLLNIFHSGVATTMRLVAHRGPSRLRVVRPFLLTPEYTVKSNSPLGPEGVFSCELCGVHASERARMEHFVFDTFELHSRSVHHARQAVLQGGAAQDRSRRPRHAKSTSPKRIKSAA